MTCHRDFHTWILLPGEIHINRHTRRSEQILAHFHTTLDQDGFSKSLVKAEFKALFREANTTFSGQSPERRWRKCLSRRKRKYRNLLRVVSLGLARGLRNSCGEQCAAMFQGCRLTGGLLPGDSLSLTSDTMNNLILIHANGWSEEEKEGTYTIDC